MHLISDRRRRSPNPPLPGVPADPGTARPAAARPAAAEEGWISVAGQGGGFDDCPLCRELASRGEAVPAVVAIRRESLPLLARSGWLDDLLELVGPDATVRMMGREMEAEPVEVISMATFLARLGYD